MVNKNGAIVPNADDLNAAVSQLVKGIAGDEKVNAQFRANPVGYFSAVGIPTDGIPELMKELGLKQEAASLQICGVWSCFWTSGCALTCWNTGSAAAAIKLEARAFPLG